MTTEYEQCVEQLREELLLRNAQLQTLKSELDRTIHPGTLSPLDAHGDFLGTQ